MGMKARTTYFSNTKGEKNSRGDDNNSKNNIFTRDGRTTYNRLAKNREFFFSHNIKQINEMMKQNGYETKLRTSTHSGSKAKMIVVQNYKGKRNVTFVEVSPGSDRHGNVPYVRISTSDSGKFKLINSTKKEYITDHKEKAKLIFKRRKKK